MQHSLGAIVIHDSLSPMIGTINYFERNNLDSFNFKIMDVKGESLNIFTLQTLWKFKTALSIINGNIPDDYINFSLKVENISVTITKLSRLVIHNTVNKKIIHRFKINNKDEIHEHLSFIIGRLGIVISQINLLDDFIKEGGDINVAKFNIDSLNVGSTRLIAPNIFTSTLNVPYCSFDKTEELISIGMGRNKINLDKTVESDYNFINFLIKNLEDLKENRAQVVKHDPEKPEHCRYVSFVKREFTTSDEGNIDVWNIVINTDTLITGTVPSKLTFVIGNEQLDYFIDSFVEALKEKV